MTNTLPEHHTAAALEEFAEQQEKASATHRTAAIRFEGARQAFTDAVDKSVSSVLARLDADAKSGQLGEDGERLAKRYLVQVIHALRNARDGAETSRIHELGKAKGTEAGALSARARARVARASAKQIADRMAAENIDEEDARRPPPNPAIADAENRVAAEQAETAPAPPPREAASPKGEAAPPGAKKKRRARKKATKRKAAEAAPVVLNGGA